MTWILKILVVEAQAVRELGWICFELGSSSLDSHCIYIVQIFVKYAINIPAML